MLDSSTQDFSQTNDRFSLDLLWAHVPMSTIGGVLISSLMAVYYLPNVGISLTVGWWATSMTIYVVRIMPWMAARITGKQPTPEVYSWVTIGSSLAVAAAQGAAGFWIVYRLPMDQAFLAILTGAVISVATLGLSYHRRIFPLLPLTICLPMVTASLIAHGSQQFFLSLALLVFVLALIILGRHHARLMKGFVSLDRKNRRLLSTLSGTNTDLAEEIGERLSAERLAKESEETLRKTIGNLQDIMFRISLAGEFLSISSACARIIGYQPEELEGTKIQELMKDPRGFDLLLAEMRGGGGRIQFAKRALRKKEGGFVWLSINSSFFQDSASVDKGIEGTARDISELESTVRELTELREQAEVTLASLTDGVVSTNINRIVTFLNPAAYKLCGWRPRDAVGEHFGRVIALMDARTEKRIDDVVRLCLQDSQPVHPVEPLKIVRKGGHVASRVEVNASPMFDADGRLKGCVVVLRDVTQLQEMAFDLTYQATHDALTGLINRSQFERKMEALLKDTSRDNEHHSLCYLDLDQFKIVNDSCGHAAGDQLLREVSARLLNLLPEGGTLARLGGDEFAAILENQDLDQARKTAVSFIDSVKDYRFAWEGQFFEIGVSIGIVEIQDHGGAVSDILNAADSACYLAKDSGRNRVQSYHAGKEELNYRKGEMAWVHRIHVGWEGEKFELYAQPLMAIQAPKPTIVGAEILLRLREGPGILVTPESFLPAAERYHLMPEIDRKVVKAAFGAIERDEGVLRGLGHCCVNLSGQSVADDNFLDFVIQQLDEFQIDPGRICFEITETAVISNLAKAARFIAVLRDMGLTFALDDFGSGLCSFQYLKQLPVDMLKIDGAFVKDICNDPIDRAMVESINSLGKILGVKTVAEYVDSPEALKMITDMGIDYAQGFFLAKPEPLGVKV